MTEGITLRTRVHFRRSARGRKQLRTAENPANSTASGRVPRLARLMALAIRLDGLVRRGEVADQAELARLPARHPGTHHADHEPSVPGPRHPGIAAVFSPGRAWPRPACAPRPATDRRRAGLATPAADVATAHDAGYGVAGNIGIDGCVREEAIVRRTWRFSPGVWSRVGRRSQPARPTLLLGDHSAFRFLRIFRASGSLISLCRGTASITPVLGLIQSEWEAPSLLR